MSKLIIFDLDGVIFDTEKNMIKSWSVVQKKCNVKISFDSYKKNIGLPFLQILKNIGITKNKKKIEKIYKESSLKYNNKVKLFPKVKSILRKLRKNHELAVVTSKDWERTNKLLEKYNLIFKCVSCPKRNLRGKPFPDQINYVLKKLKISNKNAVFYVGDTRFDYLAAKKAKVNFIHASYGFEKKIINVKNKITNLDEIISFLDE